MLPGAICMRLSGIWKPDSDAFRANKYCKNAKKVEWFVAILKN